MICPFVRTHIAQNIISNQKKMSSRNMTYKESTTFNHFTSERFTTSFPSNNSVWQSDCKKLAEINQQIQLMPQIECLIEFDSQLNKLKEYNIAQEFPWQSNAVSNNQAHDLPTWMSVTFTYVKTVFFLAALQWDTATCCAISQNEENVTSRRFGIFHVDCKSSVVEQNQYAIQIIAAEKNNIDGQTLRTM